MESSDNFSRQLVEAIHKCEIIIEQKQVYVQITENGLVLAMVLRVVNLLQSSTRLHFL